MSRPRQSRNETVFLRVIADPPADRIGDLTEYDILIEVKQS